MIITTMAKQPAISQPVRTTAAELKVKQPLGVCIAHDEDTAEHLTVGIVQGEGQKAGKVDSFILASRLSKEAAPLSHLITH